MKTLILNLCISLCLLISAQTENLTSEENTLRIPEAPRSEAVVTCAAPEIDSIPLSADLQAVLFDACAANNVPPEIALAVIETESNFKTDAVSYCGCYGLMQLHPAYFPAGLSPAENIEQGVAFLGRLIAQYGDIAAALTAYNVGHDNGSRSYASAVLAKAEKWIEIIRK